ncbi:MAG: DUF4292 domain-containing protein [Bacteroidota bacterium]
MRLVRLGSCLLLSGALALAAGCSAGELVSDAPDAVLPDAFPNHRVGDIVRAVSAEALPILRFESQSRIKVERPGQRATLSAKLRQSPDSLFGSLSGPFGIRVGEGLVTPDSFFVAYTFGGTFFTGAIDAAARFLPVPPTSSDLFASLTGTVSPAADVNWTMGSDSTHYLLATTLATPGGPVQRSMRIDPALWRVVETTDFTPEGDVLGVQTFSAFDQVDGVIVPRRVVLEAPLENATVVIEHQRITVNPAALSFPRPRAGRLDVQRVE